MTRRAARWGSGAFVLAWALALAACGAAPAPAPAESPTPRLPTSALNTRPTLPPTWTPTPPPLPPTLTATPTPRPTLTDAEVCAAVSPAQVTDMGEVLFIVLETNTPNVRLQFTLTNRDTGETFSFEIDGGRQTAATLPLADLPGAGDYEWAQTAVIGSRSGLCEQTGRFVVLARPPLAQLIDLLSEAGILGTLAGD